MKPKLAITVILALLALSFTPAVIRGESLESQIRVAAQSIAKYCQSRGVDSIGMGFFNGPNTHAMLATQLEEQLVQAGMKVVNVNDEPPLLIDGDFELKPADPSDPFSFEDLIVKIRIKNSLGTVELALDEVFEVGSGSQKRQVQLDLSTPEGSKITLNDGEFEIKTDQPSEMAVLIGKTVSFGDNKRKLKKGPLRRQQLAKLQDAIKHPKICVEDCKVKSRASSPYSMEIVVEGKSLSAVPTKKGRAQVNIDKGQIYSVVIGNDSEYDAAVELTIDGVNSFFFSEQKRDKSSRHWIIPAGERRKISGWFVRVGEVDQFKITGFAASAAFRAKVESQELGGMIVANYSMAWDPRDPAPEAVGLSRGETGDLWTGFGGRTEVEMKPLKRSIGPVRETVVIEYRPRH